MPRAPRSAPERESDPLDVYSTWDIRVARIFYYSFAISALILMLGLYISLITKIPTATWEWYVNLGTGFQVAIVGAIITAHLVVIVLFYAMGRGGMYRMCTVLYKNRLISKKYEDHTTLRWLVGVLLISAYVTIFAVIIGVSTKDFWMWVITVWKWMLEKFNVGLWILWSGLVILLVVLFFFFMFVIWNHIVFLVLKIITRAKEEEEVDIEIKKEKVQKMSEDQRIKEYEKETGKAAVYRGKEMSGYTKWKKKMGVKK